MTDTSKFPADVAKLFEPRPPLRYVEQIDYEPAQRKTADITGIGSFLDKLKEYKEIEFPKEEHIETPQMQQQRAKREKQLLNKKKLDEDFAKWNPSEDPHIKGDPYNTLFVGRLHYDVTEIDLQKEFSKFGAIERVRVVRDKESGKSKGYAFIVYERESGTRAAYKEANGLKIKGRTILTDIERSRTMKSWVPRRLGGGVGGRGYSQKRKITYKEAPKARFDSSSSRGRGGGSRFGSRGGFDGGRGGGRGGRGGGYERSRFDSRGPPRNNYSSYDSKPRYTSRSDRPERGGASSERPVERSERPERSERYEYNSRSRREDRDFTDRDRDRDRDSRINSEREKEREKYRERKLEQNKDRLRY